MSSNASLQIPTRSHWRLLFFTSLASLWCRNASSFTSYPVLGSFGFTSGLSRRPMIMARFLFEEKAHFYRRNEEPDDANQGGSSSHSSEGPNWIERSFAGDEIDPEDSDSSMVYEFNVGVSGKSYQTGSLAQRTYLALLERSDLYQQRKQLGGDEEELEELRRTYKAIALDFAAKEAVRAALLENGLELALEPEMENFSKWGRTDTIRLLDEDSDLVYNSWEEVLEDWKLGQMFDFVARQVPARIRALSVDELLAALDPDGELRQQAEESGMTLPDVEPETLEELAIANMQRVHAAPRVAATESEAFAGYPDRRGYRPIHASALVSLSEDKTLPHATVMHVMDALVSHGCLLVDLTDGGKTYDKAKAVANMWLKAKEFYDKVDNNQLPDDLEGMITAEQVGSSHAKVGFASYDAGDIQFLETRLTRTGELLPSAARAVLGETGCEALRAAFNVMSDVSKHVARLVIATSSQEVGALEGPEAVAAASRLVNELFDDGKPIQTDTVHDEGSVSMSPHRLCRYSHRQQAAQRRETLKSREVFGAHTDSTFITAVPVASVSGLEVYDEDSEQWYRPEKAARLHWEDSVRDSEDASLTLKDESTIPWFARYLVIMPGELLQVFSRSEVLAAVHRVVATQEQPSRLSAPILLRGRPGTTVDVGRYLGQSLGDPIISQCEGRRMEDIYDLMQIQSTSST